MQRFVPTLSQRVILNPKPDPKVGTLLGHLYVSLCETPADLGQVTDRIPSNGAKILRSPAAAFLVSLTRVVRPVTGGLPDLEDVPLGTSEDVPPGTSEDVPTGPSKDVPQGTST